MTRSQVEYILSVERLNSFSKAAEACFVTQSTLSAMVAKFEQQIGIIIFDRKTKPISLTLNGVSIIRHLKNIKREFLLLDERVGAIKGYESGHFSIACIPTVAPYLFPLILNSISETHKKMNFDIRETTTESVVEEILAGDVDIGIVSTPLNHKDLVEYPLYDEDFLLYDCGMTKRKSKYKVSDIDLNRLWLLEEGHCLRNQVGNICELREHQKIKGNITYNCGSMFTLIEMVNQNKGVTLLPRLAVENNPHIQSEHVYPFFEPIPVREIGIVTHKNFIKNRILKEIIELIKQSVRSYKSDGKTVIIEPF